MPEVSHFEPRLALDGGADGLDAYRVIASAGPKLAVPGGFVVVEVGQGQATEISALFAAAGLRPRAPWKDLGGIDRVVAARN
jgi:release factor glutamine methyltransferase